MKWALLFFVFSVDGQDVSIDRREILKTFVDGGDCVQEKIKRADQAERLAIELGREKAPTAYLFCMPYNGPWKKETRWEKK